jgi:hypothetical protein
VLSALPGAQEMRVRWAQAVKCALSQVGEKLRGQAVWKQHYFHLVTHSLKLWGLGETGEVDMEASQFTVLVSSLYGTRLTRSA